MAIAVQARTASSFSPSSSAPTSARTSKRLRCCRDRKVCTMVRSPRTDSRWQHSPRATSRWRSSVDHFVAQDSSFLPDCRQLGRGGAHFQRELDLVALLQAREHLLVSHLKGHGHVRDETRNRLMRDRHVLAVRLDPDHAALTPIGLYANFPRRQGGVRGRPGVVRFRGVVLTRRGGAAGNEEAGKHGYRDDEANAANHEKG